MIGILIPSFHIYYSKQLNQLLHSIKIDVWRCLTSRKHLLSIEQASSIHPEVEDLLNKMVGNYIKQKERQKMKPIISDCETSLRQENEELCISKQVLEKKIEELLELQEQWGGQGRFPPEVYSSSSGFLLYYFVFFLHSSHL